LFLFVFSFSNSSRDCTLKPEIPAALQNPLQNPCRMLSEPAKPAHYAEPAAHTGATSGGEDQASENAGRINEPGYEGDGTA
jgi:hypothetical protein